MNNLWATCGSPVHDFRTYRIVVFGTLLIPPVVV